MNNSDSFFKRFIPKGAAFKTDNHENNVVIYTRVSSKEQLSNDSLENQYKTCTNFAVKQGFKIVEYFGGIYESAKSDEDRKEFQRMINFVCTPKNRVSGIVVYSHDRFSRTGLDGAFEVLGKLKRHRVKVFSAMYNIDPDSMEGKVMLTMSLLQANVENESKSKLTIQRVRAKLEAGYWSHNLPKGYSRDEKKRIYINKDGYLIREAFEMMLKEYTITEVQKAIALKGYNITTKRWFEIFSNPFFCGIMLSRSNNYNPIEGTHPKIISIAKFKRLNSTRFNIRLKRTKDSIINELIPLKGYLRCECGAKFTGYYSKQKKRPYYICNNFECRTSLPAIFMSDSFKGHLKSQLLTELSNQQLISKLSSFITELSRINEDLVIEQKETLNKAKEKLYKLADALLGGELDKKIFQERYTELENKVAEEEQKLFDLDVRISNHEKVSETIIKFFRNAVRMWENGDLHVKRQIQKIFYPDGIIYNKSEGQYRTFRKNSLLHLMNVLTSTYTKKRADFSVEILNKSAQVPRVGIEPTLLTEHDFESCASTSSAI
jgi:site-specific DNA recombinase